MNTQQAPTEVAVLKTIEGIAQTRFREHDMMPIEYKKGLSVDEMVDMLGDVAVLGVRSEGAPAELIRRLPNLQAIGCYCIGYDKVGLDAAAERQIPVFNAPFQTSQSVAELVMGQTYALHRDLAEQNRKLHEGVWDKHSRGQTIGGKLMAILGYGGIGQRLGLLAEGNGMEVAYYDVADRQPLGNATRYTDREALLRDADVLTVHVPGGLAKPAVTAEDLALLRTHAFVINTARKDSVDAHALDRATRTKVIAGAAVDVFDREPADNNQPFESVFRGNPHVLLTSHLGGSTVEGQHAIAEYVTNKLVRYLQTGEIEGAVNLADLDLEAQAA